MMAILRKLSVFLCLCGSMTLALGQDAEYNPDTAIGKVSFTFDCSQWGDKGLQHIIDVMTRRGIQGTFFCTGRFLEVNPKGLQKIVDGGFEVANHSYEHDKKNSIYECNRVAYIYKKATGKVMSPYFRAPFLYEEQISWPYYAKNGWLEGYVSLISCDSLVEFKHISDQKFLKNFATYVYKGAYERIAIHQPDIKSGPGHINGSSILMHIDGYRSHLLEQMIDIVQGAGYVCTTHSQVAQVRKKKFTPYSKRGIPMKDIIAQARREQRLAPNRPDGVGTFVANASTQEGDLRPSGLFPATGNPTDLAKAKEIPLKKEPVMPELNFHLEDAHPDSDKMAAAKKAFAEFKPFEDPEKQGERGDMALTFNCVDYNPVALKLILNTLRDNGVESTFFVTEEYLKAFPGTVRLILEHGHEIGGLESTLKSDKGSTSPLKAKALRDLYREKTGLELTRLYRFNNESGTVDSEKWTTYASDGWGRGNVSLDTCDLDEKWKKITDASFISKFKIYMSQTPIESVQIVDIPLHPGSGSMDGAVVQMHTHGYRYHLLEKMISYIRSKGYNLVPQSKIKNVRMLAHNQAINPMLTF